MADSTNFQDVVTRTTGDAALKAALRRGRSSVGKAGRAMLWTATLIVAGVALAPVSRYVRQEAETWRLLQASEVALTDSETIYPSAAWFEALSELATDPETSLTAARKAVEADPSRAFAWARIAWLESAKAGKVTASSLDALTRSMDACPLCDGDLMRWRLNFVLANWSAMPEAVRSRAFEQAELLSWSGENAEFLAEMQVKSDLAGIPFAAYRAAVKSPVRSWNLLFDPAAVATAAPVAPGG
jgi:hypothetical protein